nr:MAG TPA: single-stranded DNA-binding protein [Caudoviricetes sp.]
MIKTVFFSCDYPHHEAIDDQINSWLAENPGIKLIDIKFQSNVSAVADSVALLESRNSQHGQGNSFQNGNSSPFADPNPFDLPADGLPF